MDFKSLDLWESWGGKLFGSTLGNLPRDPLFAPGL